MFRLIIKFEDPRGLDLDMPDIVESKARHVGDHAADGHRVRDHCYGSLAVSLLLRFCGQVRQEGTGPCLYVFEILSAPRPVESEFIQKFVGVLRVDRDGLFEGHLLVDAAVQLADAFVNAQRQFRVDGCDVKLWKLKQLRGGIGTATQDVFLFSDTVEGNVAFGNQDLTLDEVKDFARRADAAEFIDKLPEGYDTIIGERGVGLSGGQRQRIALARALAVKPSILVMDDTTSAVDSETEQYIQDQLRQLPFDCTKFIIAQRISSMRDADLILVLQDGKITEQGTHQELLQKRGYYWQTYCLQYGIPMKEAV